MEMARDYWGIGIVLSYMSKSQETLDSLNKALYIHEGLSDRVGLARDYGNRGVILFNMGKYHPPSLYHLQQAYEKCIKSYFIFKEVNFNKTPEATVYNNILRRLGHDTKESTIILTLGSCRNKEPFPLSCIAIPSCWIV